jgi:hypothetical protein
VCRHISKGSERTKKEVVKNTGIADLTDASGKPLVPLSKAIKGGVFVFLAGTARQEPATGEMMRGDAARA